ncbi:ATP-binding protein [Bacillus sp. DJP31]|uniref:ATP-binding protein n=1 Tax=Bacillus sp. DJP31 TaxID=3409789 RepID=UPI003BB5A6DC
MLAEKLLLHVLIILTPILIYYALFESRKLGNSPYLIGILHGIATFLCMIFAYESYGLYWDLRYVPLVLAALYGGPISGGIVFIVILVTRTLIGGDALLFGYMSAILASIVPLLFSKKFITIRPKKRVSTAVLIGFWPAFIQLCILITYVTLSDVSSKSSLEIFMYVTFFGLIQLVAVAFAATLYEANIEKQQMKEEINRSEKLNTLGELAASIAHEVRNPLTVVKGFLQLMNEDEQNDNKKYLSLVLSELERAEAIISDYLNFAKPQLEIVEEFSLSEVIHENIALLEPLATKNGVVLVESLEKNIIIETDRNKLKQALINIIKNAIEATNDGGSVSAILKKEKHFAKIIIRDNGKGMTQEQVSRIGTLFYTTKDKGTGLGTLVSIRIIEAMKGKMTFSSKQGVGTEVTILIPFIQE